MSSNVLLVGFVGGASLCLLWPQKNSEELVGNVQGSIAPAIERVRPSVVQVALLLRYRLAGSSIELRTSRLFGSGVLADGSHAITARHVADDIEGYRRDLPAKVSADLRQQVDPSFVQAEIVVRFALKEVVSANLRILGNFFDIGVKGVKKSRDADVAILELVQNALVVRAPRMKIGTDEIGVPPVVAAFDRNFAVDGESIAVSGYPLSIPSLVTTVGHIASAHVIEGSEIFQLGDVQVNPGNSGGPVYRTKDGVVIGIASAYRNAPREVSFRINGKDASALISENSGLTLIVPIQKALELLFP